MNDADSTSRFDNFYIKEDQSADPKEYFKVAENILRHKFSVSDSSFMDIGCAAGDFIKYINLLHPNVSCNGLDAFEELLIEAKKRVPSAKFHLGDMNSLELKHDVKYDIVTMMGVLSIFSNENWINNFASLIKPGGVGLLFGMVNPFPWDVFVKLRNQQGLDEYGWNSWSAETIKKRFLEKGFVANIEFWQPPITIPHRPSDPLRSWTIDLKNGGAVITNASRMIHDFAFITLKAEELALK